MEECTLLDKILRWQDMKYEKKTKNQILRTNHTK